MNKEEQYDQYWQEIESRKRANAEYFDRWILTLSSGGIAISLTIVSSIIDLQAVNQKWLLICTWVLFCLSILLTVITFVTSQKGLDIALTDAEKYFLEDEKEYRNKKIGWGSATQWLSKIAGFAFVTAVIFMIIFTSINVKIGAQKSMSKEESSTPIEQSIQPQRIEEGAPIPKMQKAVEPLEKGQPIPSMQPAVEPQNQGTATPAPPQDSAPQQQTSPDGASSADSGSAKE